MNKIDILARVIKRKHRYKLKYNFWIGKCYTALRIFKG